MGFCFLCYSKKGKKNKIAAVYKSFVADIGDIMLDKWGGKNDQYRYF